MVYAMFKTAGDIVHKDESSCQDKHIVQKKYD